MAMDGQGIRRGARRLPRSLPCFSLLRARAPHLREIAGTVTSAPSASTEATRRPASGRRLRQPRSFYPRRHPRSSRWQRLSRRPISPRRLPHRGPLLARRPPSTRQSSPMEPPRRPSTSTARSCRRVGPSRVPATTSARSAVSSMPPTRGRAVRSFSSFRRQLHDQRRRLLCGGRNPWAYFVRQSHRSARPLRRDSVIRRVRQPRDDARLHHGRVRHDPNAIHRLLAAMKKVPQMNKVPKA